jgi:hypothetical protein
MGASPRARPRGRLLVGLFGWLFERAGPGHSCLLHTYQVTPPDQLLNSIVSKHGSCVNILKCSRVLSDVFVYTKAAGDSDRGWMEWAPGLRGLLSPGRFHSGGNKQGLLRICASLDSAYV